MNEEEIMLDHDPEVDTEEVEEIEDVDATDEDLDDEFEYDEDGNIIIPEVIEDGDEEAVTEQGETEEDGEGEDSKNSEEVTEPNDDQKTKDEELAELRRKVKAYESQGKDTLAKLGVQTDDVMKGLADLAAEASGVTIEEYLKQKEQSEKAEEARMLIQNAEFEKLARADLTALQSEFPETREYKDIRDLPEAILKKFGQFRDMGLSPKEAYSAANPDGIRSNVASAVKKQSLHETKNHLQSAVPKGANDTPIKVSRKALAEWRDLFPGKSDKEIIALYRKTASKE